jgi:hypothetical protein
LANKVRGGYASCRGDPVGVGYTVVEVVQGCYWVMHKGGAGWSQKLKPEPLGLGFGQCNAGGLCFG